MHLEEAFKLLLFYCILICGIGLQQIVLSVLSLFTFLKKITINDLALLLQHCDM